MAGEEVRWVVSSPDPTQLRKLSCVHESRLLVSCPARARLPPRERVGSGDETSRLRACDAMHVMYCSLFIRFTVSAPHNPIRQNGEVSQLRSRRLFHPAPRTTAHGFLTKNRFGLSIQCGSLRIIVITPGLPIGSGTTGKERCVFIYYRLHLVPYLMWLL